MGVYIRNITREQFLKDCNAMGILFIAEGISEIDLVRCWECMWFYADKTTMMCEVLRKGVPYDGFCFRGERRTDDLR